MPRSLLAVLFVVLLAAPSVAVEAVDAALKKMKDKKPETRLAGVAAAAELQDEKITAQLIKLLKDKDWHVRELSMQALAIRTGDADRKKAATALAARLPSLGKSTGTASEYALAIAALGRLGCKESVAALVDIDTDEAQETAKARLMAAAEAPFPETVDELIKFLSKGRNRGRNNQRQYAVAALRYVTGANLGNDPDKWRAWWKKSRASWSLTAVKDERLEKARQAEAKAKEREEKKAERERKKKENEEKRQRKPKKEREGPPD